MKQLDMIYEGKAKKVYATDDPNAVIVDYKDDATAFNGQKKGTIVGKGAINNRMTNFLMKKLEEKGVPTHYIEELDERRTVVKRVTIIPLEVIIRNKAAGSFSKRLGIKEGTELKCSTLEFSYKDDDLGDPLINYAFEINDFLKEFFAGIGIELIDFKLEFGKTADGTIVLADEISPDTCRYWDIKTGEHLDKDRFRRDLGDPEGAYKEVFKRLGFGE